LAAKLGFSDRHFTGIQALAECDFVEGDIVQGRKRVCEALDLARLLGGNDEETDAWMLLTSIELTRGSFASAQRSAIRAFEKATIVTRMQRCAALAHKAEALFHQNLYKLAAGSIVSALELPPEETTWAGKAHARAVLASIEPNEVRKSDLLSALGDINFRNLKGPALIDVAGWVGRLKVDVAPAIALRSRAKRYAKRIGASTWEDLFQ
jgi:hypothetical protein